MSQEQISGPKAVPTLSAAGDDFAQVAYETELNAMHIAAGLGSCEAMKALSHGTTESELASPSAPTWMDGWMNGCMGMGDIAIAFV